MAFPGEVRMGLLCVPALTDRTISPKSNNKPMGLLGYTKCGECGCGLLWNVCIYIYHRETHPEELLPWASGSPAGSLWVSLLPSAVSNAHLILERALESYKFWKLPETSQFSSLPGSHKPPTRKDVSVLRNICSVANFLLKHASGPSCLQLA